MATGLQPSRTNRSGRLLLRSAALLATLLGVHGVAMAGSRTASMRVGAQVVASVSLSASATAGSLGVETRSFGGRPSAVLVQQRSGSPLRLRSGARLPSEADAPLEIAGGNLQLALHHTTGPAEVVVTIFSDGTPPRS